MKRFTSNTQKKGEFAEDIASMFLVKQGYGLIERNYTLKTGEIDIIAKKGKRVFFVEVKASYVSRETLNSLGNKGNMHVSREMYKAEYNISSKKRERIKRTIEVYLSQNRDISHFSFSVIIVYVSRESNQCKVIFFKHEELE